MCLTVCVDPHELVGVIVCCWEEVYAYGSHAAHGQCVVVEEAVSLPLCTGSGNLPGLDKLELAEGAGCC